MFACGNCVYFALTTSFPPTASWCVILPVWLMLLSLLKLNRRVSMRCVPELWITVPLVLLTWLMAPATLGPLLGLWIPVCIVIGTATAWRTDAELRSQPTLRLITFSGILALVLGGGWNWFLTEPTASRPHHIATNSAS